MTKETRPTLEAQEQQQEYIISINHSSSADDNEYSDTRERASSVRALDSAGENSIALDSTEENSVFGFHVVIGDIENNPQFTALPPQTDRQISGDSRESMRSLDSPASYSPRKIINKFFHTSNKIASQDSLIKQYESDLQSNLEDLHNSPKNVTHKAESYFLLGNTYKKLARLDDFQGKKPEESLQKRKIALDNFDKAITKLEETYSKHKTPSDKYNTTKAKYHATKAKCLYDMKDIEQATKECSIALNVDYNNGFAHEVMGYIHRTNGNFREASESFKNATAKYSIANDAHYVISMFHESITYAALGNIERASLKLALVLDNKDQVLALEDKIFLEKVCTSKYPKLIQNLASRSQNNITIEQHSSLQRIASTFDFELSSTSTDSAEQLDDLHAELEKQTQALEEEKRAHLNDKEKFDAILEELTSKNMPLKSDIPEIESDPDLHAFYKEIQRHLIATYNAAQSIGTGFVENGKTGKMGTAAKVINIANEFIPTPKVFSLPFKATAMALENMDKSIQETRVNNFNAIVDDLEEMTSLSNLIALRLTEQRKDLASSSHTIKSQTKKDIKYLAKSEAAVMATFIEEIICDGRIKDCVTIKIKADQIVAIVNMQQAYTHDSIQNLPKYTFDIAETTLSKIKALLKHWHPNSQLEKKFIEHLASNIHSYGITSNIDKDTLSNFLAKTICDDENIICKQHRTILFWKMKGVLLEKFLSQEDYFSTHVRKAYGEYIDTAHEGHIDERKISANDLSIMIHKAITNNTSVPTEDTIAVSSEPSTARQSDGTLTPPDKREDGGGGSGNSSLLGSAVDENHVDLDELMISIGESDEAMPDLT